MQYKTIALALIQDRPNLHEQLRQSRRILTTLEQYATALKACHESWKTKLAMSQSEVEPIQLASAALELATQELIDSLPPSTETDSLDAAMAFVRRHMPSA